MVQESLARSFRQLLQVLFLCGMFYGGISSLMLYSQGEKITECCR